MPRTVRPKAYSYVRFSTPEQAKGDSQRRQIAAATEYAQKHGLELDTTLRLEDLGVSAFRGANLEPDAALGRFLRAIEDGMVSRGSYLLLENLDRFSRENAWDALDRLRPIIKAGIHVVTLQDGQKYDSASLTKEPWAIVMAVMSLSRAHDESRRKGQRLKEVWGEKRKRALVGEAMTSRLPAWLKLGADRKIRLVPERAAIIKDIFKRTLAGQGRGTIAKDFNKRRLAPWGDGVGGARKAKHWHPTYIAKILRNPSTYGLLVPHTVEIDVNTGREVRVRQEPLPNYFPAAISERQFQAVQRLLEIKDTRRGVLSSRGVSSMVAGLARCPICGETMTRVTKGPKGGRPFLVCTKAKNGAGCKYRSVPIEFVEEALIRGLPEELANFPGADPGVMERINQLTYEIETDAHGLGALLDSFSKKPSQVIREKIDELERWQLRRKEELAQLEDVRAATVGPWLERDVARLSGKIDSQKPDPQGINLLLRGVVKRIVVDYQKGYLNIEWKNGGVSNLLFLWPEEFTK